MQNVIEMNTPGIMNNLLILIDLLRSQVVTTMDGNRHDVGNAVADVDRRPCETDLHHVPGKICRRMSVVLVVRSNIAAGRIIKCSQDSGRYSSAAGIDQRGDTDTPVRGNDRLYGLDH